VNADVLGVGIVGAKWGIKGQLPGWRALPGVEVRAICTSSQASAERAAGAHGIRRAYGSFEDMLADDDVHIINLTISPRLRYPMALAALRRGKHVFNCLPFTTNLADAKTLLQAQRDARVIGVCDGYFQWVPAFLHMKRLIEDGYIGKLFGVSVNFHLGLYNQPSSAAFPEKWRAFATNGASALRNLGSHALHALVSLFGEIEETTGQVETFLREWNFDDGVKVRPQSVDTAMALLRFRGGGMGQLNLSWVVADGSGLSVEAFGSAGRLVLRAPGFPHLDSRLWGAKAGKFNARSEQEIPIPDDLVLRVAEARADADLSGRTTISMVRMYADMARAIRYGGDGAPSFAQAVHVQAAVEAIQASARTRTWLRISDIEASV